MAAGLGAVALAFLGVVLLAWGFQRRLIYFPFQEVPPPEAVGLTGAEAVEFETADGLRLRAWFLPPAAPGPRPAFLVCNGNGGNRALRADIGARLRRMGAGVLLFDYRGYGGNPGTPSEAGLIEDTRAARAYLEARPEVDPSRVVLLGESLGAAVAIACAVERPPAGIILRSPFTSLADVGRHHYPFLPVGMLLRDRYPSLERIRRLRCPLLVIAGEADRIVLPAMSRRLFEAAPEPKRLVLIPGADHNDPDLFTGPRLLAEVEAFMARAGAR